MARRSREAFRGETTVHMKMRRSKLPSTASRAVGSVFLSYSDLPR